jgi:hypothetical protein
VAEGREILNRGYSVLNGLFVYRRAFDNTGGEASPDRSLAATKQ